MLNHWLDSMSYLFLFVNFVWDLVAQCIFSNILRMSIMSQKKILFLKFILRENERERQRERERRRERESQADSREPEVGLNLRTLVLWPEPKSRVGCSTQRHPGIPGKYTFKGPSGIPRKNLLLHIPLLSNFIHLT